jgi:hypothetical protein
MKIKINKYAKITKGTNKKKYRTIKINTSIKNYKINK